MRGDWIEERKGFRLRESGSVPDGWEIDRKVESLVRGMCRQRRSEAEQRQQEGV